MNIGVFKARAPSEHALADYNIVLLTKESNERQN